MKLTYKVCLRTCSYSMCLTSLLAACGQSGPLFLDPLQQQPEFFLESKNYKNTLNINQIRKLNAVKDKHNIKNLKQLTQKEKNNSKKIIFSTTHYTQNTFIFL